MKRLFITAASLLLGASALAQGAATPLGTWRSVDDASKQPKSEVVISDKGGVLVGHVARLLRKDADPGKRCDLCKGERKDKPIVGMEIIRGAKKAPDADVWDGHILDPETGKEYTLKLIPAQDGKTLGVRGYIGPFFRTQTWVRVQ